MSFETRVTDNYKKWANVWRLTKPTTDMAFETRKEILNYNLGLESGLLSDIVPQDLKDKYISMMFVLHSNGISWWYPGLYKKKEI